MYVFFFYTDKDENLSGMSPMSVSPLHVQLQADSLFTPRGTLLSVINHFQNLIFQEQHVLDQQPLLMFQYPDLSQIIKSVK